MHEVLVIRLGGLSLPRKSVVRLTDRPDMTIDVYRGRKTTTQQQQMIRYGQLLSFQFGLIIVVNLYEIACSVKLCSALPFVAYYVTPAQ